ncbi:ATP synthase complex assembly protein atp12 [Apiotrichum porosum]|uniref:ATP synthase complex assembly protein atp12 n=1 Tax=Apiotrichum porosum TaxID=105984 RepID=A0A427XL74_9TREE|nr:ATP synthase complex assembly protein atp12 [Apiotrichum porosum]RSH79659.1 ATP synthase complex assembly protein atp12 [Apiotrichum porosum]
MASLSRSVVRSALQSTRVATRCVPSGSRAPIGIAHRHELRAFGSATASRHAEARPGPPLSQTNRAEVTLRRFWKKVNMKEEDGGYLVQLDHRNLKTPGGTKLIIPKDRRLLALLIANEWENQDEVLKQHALPTTSLASRAIDGMGDAKIREGVIEALMAYLDTDTICDAPEALVRLQGEHWDPLFSWMKDRYGVDLIAAKGIAPAIQSPETFAKLRIELEKMDIWELAAFERAVYATKSFVIALALVKGRLTAHDAALASHVEVASQIELWGEVEDTHDVDYQDIRRALGSVACLLVKA